MKKIVELERPRGRGSIYREDGTLVGDADYEIVVLQEVHVDGDDELPGLKEIEGWIEPINGPKVGEHLVLHLDDARRLDFFYADITGKIENRSKGLYEPN